MAIPGLSWKLSSFHGPFRQAKWPKLGMRLVILGRKGEPLFDTWELYKDLLRLYPFHGLENGMIIKIFYIGLL